jgi:hypothetical protein
MRWRIFGGEGQKRMTVLLWHRQSCLCRLIELSRYGAQPRLAVPPASEE